MKNTRTRFISIDTEAVGQRINKLITEKNYTKRQVAEELGVSPQTVFKWINNPQAMPSIDSIVRLSMLFGVSTDYILMGDKPP